MSGSSQSVRQGHFACMYRLFCLISILYEYIYINQSKKKKREKQQQPQVQSYVFIVAG